MNKLNTVLISFLLYLFNFQLIGQNQLPEGADPKAVEVINKFLEILQNNTLDKSASLVVPYLHKSMLDKFGKTVSPDVMSVHFKRSHANARLYAYPVVVSRTKNVSLGVIGFAETNEKGNSVEYFIGKKNGRGYPGAIRIFFPENGGEPKISYLGI
ncbi:MAG: hypothetical protein LC115_07245 [Bacteroidia bacterium]|nr:hypothetical protein [Bacteroidia bacterium]